MKTQNQFGRTSINQRFYSGFERPLLTRTLMATAVSLAISGQAVQAQESEYQPIEEVVATGFRQSLENAVQAKKSANTVVESISAEDIGKLPDISIADSVARLPGVSAQRTGGQSSAINIRGLDQGLVLSTLNGREQVATSGGRAIEFSQYPSELVTGVDVYKSTEARLIEGGVGGTVALKLARPLDKPQDDPHLFNINARVSLNDRAGDSVDSDEIGSRFSFSYQGIFADDTIGVVLGYASLIQANVDSKFGTDTFTSRDLDGDGEQEFLPFRYSAEELGGEDKRDGFLASIQWRPNDNFSAAFDSYYTKFESDGFARGVTIIGPQEGRTTPGAGALITNATFENDVITGGDFSRTAASPILDGNDPFSTGSCCGGFSITPSSDTQTRDFEDELLTLGLNVEWVAGDWTFAGDISHSKSEAFQPDERIVLHQVLNGFELNPDVEFGYRSGGLDAPSTFTLGEQFGDDPSLVHVGAYQAFPTDNEDELNAFAGDVEYAIGDEGFTSVQFGFRVSERTTSQVRRGYSVGNEAGFYQFARTNDDAFNANPFEGRTPGFTPVFVDPSLYTVEQFDEEFAGFPQYLNIDFDAVRALFPGLTPTQEFGRSAAIAGGDLNFLITESFDVEEDVAAAYTQLNFDGEFMGLPARGNIGLRYVDTDVSSTSSTILNGEVVPITIEHDYQNFLRAINFAVNVTEKDLVRLGLSRVISRADLDDLRAGNSVSVNATTGIVSGNGGNTNLDPFEADQIDISYEHYTDNGGIYTLAWFYKDLKTYILPQRLQLDFVADGFLDPNNVTLNPDVVLDPVGDFDAPANGNGGFVRGIELAMTQTFDTLPAPFDGLGVTANYSYTESSVTLPDEESGRTGSISLPGLSENVFNATLFYEYQGFETRVSLSYRDEFIARQDGIGEQLPFSDEVTTVGFQASYRFAEDSSLDGLQILFQADNLTDEPFVSFFSTEQQVARASYFGRQYFLGFSYSF